MEFDILEWSTLKLYENRHMINFPTYQRGFVWTENQRRLLIDSVFTGIDIPKLYLQKVPEGWDCIDGQQRIRAIIGFYDGEIEYERKTYQELDEDLKRKFEKYKLTITEITCETSKEDIVTLFIRLNLGTQINSGEKLNAMISNMGDLVRRMSEKPFIKNLRIPTKRFAREQVCAQMCNNSRVFNKTGDLRNSKFEDLEILYRVHKDLDLKSHQATHVLKVLDILDEIFGNSAKKIRNRASAVSIFLMVEQMIKDGKISGNEEIIKNFYLEFLEKLKEEVQAGINATNSFLIKYESKLIQGADTASSMKERRDKLNEAFEYYKNYHKIIGFS